MFHPIQPSSALLVAAIMSAPLGSLAADLHVEVTGGEVGTGAVKLGLFNQAVGFPSAPVAGQRAIATARTITAVFRDLAPGVYAVIAFQDKNGNDILDRNLLGIPTESYGFSREATGFMGPPSFDGAKVTLSGDIETITVTLR